jgi:hypothetical protein
VGIVVDRTEAVDCATNANRTTVLHLTAMSKNVGPSIGNGVCCFTTMSLTELWCTLLWLDASDGGAGGDCRAQAEAAEGP